MIDTLDPKSWHLNVAQTGELFVEGCNTVDLASEYGTPLHVLNERRLEEAASEFRTIVKQTYPGKTSVHYPFKCNAVPRVVEVIRRAGLKAEVMTEFELELALRTGYLPRDIIVNGPCKVDNFLMKCIAANVGLIVIDSIDELELLQRFAGLRQSHVNVLLRVNPDYVPRGMNRGSATGSRKGCDFGLDLKGGEVLKALGLL